MHTFESLVAEFSSPGSDKPQVIELMGDEEFTDRRTIPFFVERLLDTQEDELVRCQILNEVCHRGVYDSESEKRLMGDAVFTVIKRKDSDRFGLIRERACLAVSRFIDYPGVTALMESILRDELEEEHVRATAMYTLIDNRDRDDCREALLRLRELSEYRDSIDIAFQRLD